ncbi:hypothetical protein MYO4S_00230 [Serratia phage 4S]|nr:hypothetical protein MYO4S_00230 [Serratia phage 4S]
MPIYIAKWCSCETGGYNYSDGILSIHKTYDGAKAACEEYEKQFDSEEEDWTEIEESNLLN